MRSRDDRPDRGEAVLHGRRATPRTNAHFTEDSATARLAPAFSKWAFHAENVRR